jgi:hypothetical protein
LPGALLSQTNSPFPVPISVTCVNQWSGLSDSPVPRVAPAALVAPPSAVVFSRSPADWRMSAMRTPPPRAPTRIPKDLTEVIPSGSPATRAFRVAGQKAFQPGPIHARSSRGWAEIGVDFHLPAPFLISVNQR